MNIPIPGNVRLVFPVDSVEVERVQFSLDNDVTDIPVTYRFEARSEDGTSGAWMNGSFTVSKAQIEADAGKPFAQCTPNNLRRAIKVAVVAHVKAAS